jgi:hypothetical protein
MPTDTARRTRALSSAHILGDKLASKRAVARIRGALAELTEANLDKAQELFEKAAAESPVDALRLLLQLMEFSVPKLSRTEVTIGEGEGMDARSLTMDALQAIVREERARQEHDDSAMRALLE